MCKAIVNFVDAAGHITSTPLLPILKITNTATSVTKVTTTEDEQKFEEAVETKLAIDAALDMRIADAVKADRRSRQQAPKPSPTTDTSG